jgi:hypothetical protein
MKKPERELGTSAASFVMSSLIQGGNMKKREYMVFPLVVELTVTSSDRKKKRRIICRPPGRVVNTW